MLQKTNLKTRKWSSQNCVLGDFLSHTISPELYFFHQHTFSRIRDLMIGCVDHVLNFVGNKIFVNQRSVDNAHREIVELCPASHRPLLTKSVHVWLDLDWAPSLEVWRQMFRLCVVQCAAGAIYSSRQKSSQDLMNGTINGQSSTDNHQRPITACVCVCADRWLTRV